MLFYSHAQNMEDLRLYTALKDVARGFYVDVGAQHPDIDSVTRGFYDIGWRGINLEPVHAWHRLLCEKRPEDINLAVAASDVRGELPFYEIDDCGWSTTVEDIARAHAAKGARLVERRVETRPLSEILDAHGIAEVHFLKIDVEGAEGRVLAGLDLARHRPWILVIEAVRPERPERMHKPWEAQLLESGYEHAAFDGLNAYYVAVERAHLRQALAVPPNVLNLGRPPRDWFAPPEAPPPGLRQRVADLLGRLAAASAPEASIAADLDPGFGQRVPRVRSNRFRVEMTVSCRDCDDLAKVPDAGEVREEDGRRVQVMHNGLRVVAGGYHGDWMEEIIRRLRGHHEPQEERVFHEVTRNLPDDATMIELGGFWSLYSLWFLHGKPARRAVVVEPDPASLEVGRANAALNAATIDFVQACVGAVDLATIDFETETSGTVATAQVTVPHLMRTRGIERLDLLHCDAQGVELDVLRSCADLLRSGRIRFCMVSTHAHPISGDPLTHARCLELLRACGGRVLVEYDAGESFSGDGLIAAVFGAEAVDWRPPPISRNRASEALFRDVAYDLDETRRALRSRRRLPGRRLLAGLAERLLNGIRRGPSGA